MKARHRSSGKQDLKAEVRKNTNSKREGQRGEQADKGGESEQGYFLQLFSCAIRLPKEEKVFLQLLHVRLADLLPRNKALCLMQASVVCKT